MPSFDAVSEVDKHNLTNAVDQAQRVIANRFDFKGVEASFELNEFIVNIIAEGDFQLEQMMEVLKGALQKNKIDVSCLERGKAKPLGKLVKMDVTVRTGIDSDTCRKIVKLIKDKKLKVQAQIQGDQVRVTGKKRDDLQKVMAMLKDSSIDMPLQFSNFRD